MSTLNVSNITDGTTTVGTSYVVNGSARMWINMSAGTTIRDSFGASSLVDNGTGDYHYNFVNSMNNDDFASTTSAFRDNNTYTGIYFGDNTVSQTKTRHYTRGSSTSADTDSVYVVVHGDLA